MSRRPTKPKPASYKAALKALNGKLPGRDPSYVTKLRLEYLKKGKLTPPHKKFLNMVARNKVVQKKTEKKGCTSCGIKIKTKLGRL